MIVKHEQWCDDRAGNTRGRFKGVGRRKVCTMIDPPEEQLLTAEQWHSVCLNNLQKTVQSFELF